MLLLWLASVALSRTALANDLTDRVEAGVGRGATTVVACSSTQDAARRLSQAWALVEAQGLTDKVDGALRTLPELTDAFALDAGPLTLTHWGQGGPLTLEFGTTTPTADLAGRLGRTLTPDAPPASTPTPEGEVWRLATPTPIQVSSIAGGVRLQAGDLPGATGRALPVRLRAEDPHAEGCLVYVRDASEKLGELELLLHLAPVDRPAAARVAFTSTVFGEELESIRYAPQVPAEVRTPEPVAGVLVLGLGLDGLELDSILEDKAQRRAVRRLQRALPIGAGTTVALTRADAPLAVGAAVPLTKRWRPARTTRQVARVAKKLGLDVERTDRTHLRVRSDALTIHVAGQSGRFLLANDATTLLAMESNVGTPWVHGATEEAAARYGLVFEAAGLPGETFGALTRPLRLAVGVKERVVSAEIDLPVPFDTLVALLQARRTATEAAKAAESSEPAQPTESAPPTEIPSP